MRQYKILAHILLILPVINFAFGVPIAVQETRQPSNNMVPDVAITLSARRGDQEQDTYFGSLSGNEHAPPESPTSSTAPGHGLMDPPQIGTSKIEQVSPGLTEFPSFDYILVKPESDGSINGDAPPQSPTSSTAPDHGSTDPPQKGTSESEKVSPQLSKSPSEASLDHFYPGSPTS